MNKTKLILPLTALLMLVSCGTKTKEVKTIWGNTWGYTNSVTVGFLLQDRQKIENNKDKIDWANTEIIFDRNEATLYKDKDQNVDNILNAQFIRECNEKDYPVIAKQRNFFANNKIVVSSKEEKTVTIGNVKFNDATEANGNEKISFNNDGSYLMSACDSEGIIEQLTVKHSLDGGNYISQFYIVVAFTDDGMDPVSGRGFFEIAALA